MTKSWGEWRQQKQVPSKSIYNNSLQVHEGSHTTCTATHNQQAEAQGYVFRDSHQLQLYTARQLRSTCHSVHSSHACNGCCPWDDTCSLLPSLVLITSAVVAPSLIYGLGLTNKITGNWNYTPNYLDLPSMGNYRVCVCGRATAISRNEKLV